MSTPNSPITSASDLLSLLGALKDTSATEARLKVLEDMESQYQAKVRALGLVGDIDDLLTQAKADRKHAAELRAKTEATLAAEAAAVSQARVELAADRETLDLARRAFDVARASELRTLQAQQRTLAEQLESARQTQARADVALSQAQAQAAKVDAYLERVRAAGRDLP